MLFKNVFQAARSIIIGLASRKMNIGGYKHECNVLRLQKIRQRLHRNAKPGMDRMRAEEKEGVQLQSEKFHKKQV